MAACLKFCGNLTKNFASRRQSWRDSRQDRTEIFATVNLLLGENLGEIRGRIPARFWPPRLLLPGENHCENRGRIVPGFWRLEIVPGFLFPGENLGKIRAEIEFCSNLETNFTRKTCTLAYLPTPRVQKPGDNPKNFQSGSHFY